MRDSSRISTSSIDKSFPVVLKTNLNISYLLFFLFTSFVCFTTGVSESLWHRNEKVVARMTPQELTGSDSRQVRQGRKVYLVGGGIASLSAAALLIRDGGFCGEQIQIFECLGVPGGSLDGAELADGSFVIRGGRMFEDQYRCMFDLLESIPTLSQPEVSVAEEMRVFSRQVVTSSHCRLVRGGQRIDAPPLQLGLIEKLALGRLLLRSEVSLGSATIEDYFRSAFFQTNFWVMWATMFSFQPWHSLIEFRRYMLRFVHLLPGFNRLEGIGRTPMNQFDSIVDPLVAWLRTQGVQFHLNTLITRVNFGQESDRLAVVGLQLQQSTGLQTLAVRQTDLVLISLGSMTDDSTCGSMTTPCRPISAPSSPSWALWKQIAAESPRFGHPEVFCSDVPRTRWLSFTATVQGTAFFDFMEKFTGNPCGTGGLVTFPDSAWLLSIVLAYQPHFRTQAADVRVFWGYGLFPDKPGDFTGKPMDACSGAEILEELFFQLQQPELGRAVIRDANCIPCLMPWITSQFMPRRLGDRPEVVPAGAVNFGFIGQFCEIPDDVVFTVEYSVRSAMIAVDRLLGLKQDPPAVYKGQHDPLVLWRAFMTTLK